MTTLTTPQINYLRAKSGDDCTPPVVSDATLQLYFDTANGSLPCTILSVLEDRWMKASAAKIVLTTGSTVLSTANLDDLKKKMDYWYRFCGNGLTFSSAAVFTYRADSLQTSEPDYSHPPNIPSDFP